jgi:hypothetical protein
MTPNTDGDEGEARGRPILIDQGIIAAIRRVTGSGLCGASALHCLSGKIVPIHTRLRQVMLLLM